MELIEGRYSMLTSIDYDRKQVRIKDAIKVDEDIRGRMDIVCMTYYNSIEYLPLLLSFNHIVDPSKQEVGDIVYVPFLEDMISNNQPTNRIILDDWNEGVTIPGVLEDCTDKSLKAITKAKKDNTSNPLLNIKDRNIEYDKDSGQLTFY